MNSMAEMIVINDDNWKQGEVKERLGFEEKVEREIRKGWWFIWLNRCKQIFHIKTFKFCNINWW